MLELKEITKVYKSGDERVKALKGINLKFRESEFVSILGQSGCGKTTLLNIIGGLDRYTNGDLIINGKSTKRFKDRDWDAYRNYKVGFVFQNYNLIGHQTVLSNVELALTIGGISKKERKERAIKALEEVGLKEHIHKKPNQLSGGQMQRVAIARALVNNPDIILADEPTGALDTKTSIQVMEILKKISKNKLIIMVTHNPELAEKYSTRIIKILDGLITEDSNPIKNKEKEKQDNTSKIGRTSMSFFTAFRLSLNNLLTKKGRTILVAFAGSIGIIGIALVLSVSNGFQAYVDHIQEDTLSSYPFIVQQETTDIAGTLLSMTSPSGDEENSESSESPELKEKQYILSMLSNISTNDLKSFRKYIDDNYNKVKDDISSIQNTYSVEPLIYTEDVTGKLAKLNPSNIFKTAYSYSLMSSFTSTFSQMLDDTENLDNSYDILAGHWPNNYDEMVIVLSERNSISDLLVYSLGLRDPDELASIVTKIMSGETTDIKNDPLSFTYEDLMNVKLKLIMQPDLYKYNETHDVYEDMTADKEFMQNLYNNAKELKIVGIVTAKEGVTSMALTPGVAYTSDLVDHIIDYSSKNDIVKKQLANKDIDVFSGLKFEEKENKKLDFSDIMTVDNEMLQSAFNIKIDQQDIEAKVQEYMTDISNSITVDTSPANKAFTDNLNKFANEMFDNIDGEIDENNLDKIVQNYLDTYNASKTLKDMEDNFVIPKDTFYEVYSGLLKGLLKAYVEVYKATMAMTNIPQNIQITNQIDNSILANNSSMPSNTIVVNKEILNGVMNSYMSAAAIEQTRNTFANVMTEAVMKKEILTKVGELTGYITNSFASAFNVDQDKIAGAFKMNMSEEEIARLITASMSNTETTEKTNLLALGYQNKEEPTYISFYFTSFDGKEHFLEFIDSYNTKVKLDGEEDKEINYTDTTGILMNSVKIIVNAVTYVLIAFISISLIVSSIMIGIITYISVYERTKEIGILRAIGASKRNISSIFNAETFIIGLLSGLFGIGITYAVIPPINSILHEFTGNIPLNVTLYFTNALILIGLSVILTLIGGLIPAKAASKKDPVIALRTE